jgi:hypothetical protein
MRDQTWDRKVFQLGIEVMEAENRRQGAETGRG